MEATRIWAGKYYIYYLAMLLVKKKSSTDPLFSKILGSKIFGSKIFGSKIYGSKILGGQYHPAHLLPPALHYSQYIQSEIDTLTR